MKLLHQIIVAFGLLLVLVLGMTALLIHYVLQDHLIGTQKQELTKMGATLSSQLNVNDAQPIQTTGAASISLTAVPAVSGVEAILSDADGNIVTGPVPGFSLTESTSVQPLAMAEPVALQALWEGKDNRYIYSVNTLPEGTLTLLTPVSKIKAIERALLGKLLIVLGVGGTLVLLLSALITQKLIRPLMELQKELKKVKARHFAEVKLVKAGGEIGAVAQTVHELAGELDRYNRVQKEFIQNASHELKTPLMSIAGYAEGIRDGVFEGEGTRKGLDIILSESGRLKRIVTEMTLLAKLDSEEDIFRPAAVDIKEMLEETVERINPLVVAKGLELRIACRDEMRNSLIVSADRDKLLQALLNVVSNAARYANRCIAIEAGMEDGGIVISIADDGKGIPEHLLPHLFHRFVKGKDGETGLGLAISRAIVERCGGRIKAGNRSEGGAVFSLRLPAAA